MTDHVEAPSTRPEFVIPVRPTGVPPGLCELRPDIHVVGIEPHGAHYTTAAKLAGYILETIERQAAGRFYLWEAAQILAETHEKSPQGIKNAMRKAFSLGVLRVRMTDSDAPMDSDSRLRVEGMDSYVTPGDLNKWLETDGYPYRFPAAPEPASTPIEEAAAPIPAPSASASPAARPEAAAPEAPDSASAPAVASPEPVAAPAEAAPETSAQRRERLRVRVNYWRGQGARDWTARVAKEEGVTGARIRQILGEAKPKKPAEGRKPRQPATFCSGL